MTTTPARLEVDVVRALSSAPSLRAATAGSDLGVMEGHFSVFGDWYRVSSYWEGDFMEQVQAGAFADTIAEDRDAMRVLFDHGFDPTLGNKVLGAIRELREDDRGAYYEVPLFATSYNADLEPGLRAGVYGASFRMRVQEDSWVDEPDPSDHNPKGLPERTIIRTKVPEFGPVTFPASPGASASVRSTTDAFYERLAAHDAGSYAAACRAAGVTPPDVTGRPIARRVGGGARKAVPQTVQVNQMTPERRHQLLRMRGVL